jgi:type IV pilus assembly protein PilE
MHDRTPARGFTLRLSHGFSMIELVIAMVIAAILAALAIPAYNSYVLKSHRTEAKTALLDMASLEERYFSTQNVYSAATTDLGYSGAWPVNVEGGPAPYYQIQTPVVNAATAPSVLSPAGTPATFSITAQAVNMQVADTACATFTISSGGVQTATGTDPNPNVDCWN